MSTEDGEASPPEYRQLLGILSLLFRFSHTSWTNPKEDSLRPSDKAMGICSKIQLRVDQMPKGKFENLYHEALATRSLKFGGDPTSSKGPYIFLPPHPKHPEFVCLLSAECDSNDEPSYSFVVHIWGARANPGDPDAEYVPLDKPFITFRLESPHKEERRQDKVKFEHDYWHAQVSPENTCCHPDTPGSLPCLPVLANSSIALLGCAILSVCGKDFCRQLFISSSVSGEFMEFMRPIIEN